MKKNNMRTIEEKVRIINEMLENNISICQMSKKYNISKGTISKWLYSYKENGIEGLKSKTGKTTSQGLHLRKPKDRIEELEIELMKKDIEIARLKKGYNVKGAGQKKEFVTTFNKNTK